MRPLDVERHADVADEESVAVVRGGERRKVPRLEQLICEADLHIVNRFDFGRLFVLQHLLPVHTLVFIVLEQAACRSCSLKSGLRLRLLSPEALLTFSGRLRDRFLLRAEVTRCDPAIHAPVFTLIGHVVPKLAVLHLGVDDARQLQPTTTATGLNSLFGCQDKRVSLQRSCLLGISQILVHE